jgi:hypothetical protein
MTITRVSFGRRPILPLKFARSVMLKRVRIAGRERRRRRLRNVSDDRCVAGVTRGIASAGAGSGVGSGTGQTREKKTDGNHPRDDGGMTMRRASSAPMAPALPGGRDVTRKVHPGDADTALAPLRTMRRRWRRAVDVRDVLRDRGARAPIGRANGVLVIQPPSGIAHTHLTMRGTSHGGIDNEDIVPGAAVQTILLMWVIARGVNGPLATMTVHADIGADTDRARAVLIRRLAPKRCQRVWVPGIDPLARDPPVSLR